MILNLKKTIAVLTALIIAFSVCFFTRNITGDLYYSFSFKVDTENSSDIDVSLLFTDDFGIALNDNSTHVKTITKTVSSNHKNLNFIINGDDISHIEKIGLNIKNLQNPVKIYDFKVNSKNIKHFTLDNEQNGFYVGVKLSKGGVKKELNLNDGFTFTPYNDEVTLFINDEYKLKAKSGNYSLFGIFIIFFASFSISYLLIRFFLSRKALEKAHSADIIFIVLIVITLLLPLLLLNTKENAVDDTENRKLADFKPMFVGDNNRFNSKFMKDFETYFNDRFGLRKALLKLKQAPRKSSLNKALSSIAYDEGSALCQSDGWCFLDNDSGETELIIFKDKKAHEPKIKFISELTKLTDKKIVLLVNPLKTEIYPEKVKLFNDTKEPKWYFSDYAYQKLSSVKADNLTVINLKDLLLKAKKEDPDSLLYFKDEHHMTEYGNKVIIDYLNKHIPELSKYNSSLDIEKKYPSIPMLMATGEFIDDISHVQYYGQTYGMIFSMGQRFKNGSFATPVMYPMQSFSDEYLKDVSIKRDPRCDANITLHNKKASDINVYVYGNSFVETFSKVMATSATNVYRRRVNTTCGINTLTSPEEVAKEIKELNIDVVIIPYWQHTF